MELCQDRQTTTVERLANFCRTQDRTLWHLSVILVAPVLAMLLILLLLAYSKTTKRYSRCCGLSHSVLIEHTHCSTPIYVLIIESFVLGVRLDLLSSPGGSSMPSGDVSKQPTFRIVLLNKVHKMAL